MGKEAALLAAHEISSLRKHKQAYSHLWQLAGHPDEESEAIDLEAAACDVWEDGLRLADLFCQIPLDFRSQVQESLLNVLQQHISSLTPEQAQVPALSFSP